MLILFRSIFKVKKPQTLGVLLDLVCLIRLIDLADQIEFLIMISRIWEGGQVHVVGLKILHKE